MSKFIKICIIFCTFLSLFIVFNKVNASNVNMNLSSNTADNTTYGTNNNVTNNANNTQQSSVVVSNLTSNSYEGLTISDMINIILCSVGIIIVLLGIAILIRQKS